MPKTKQSKDPTEGLFPIDFKLFQDISFKTLIAGKPHEEPWRGWCTHLPSIHADEVHLRTSKRVLHVKGDLETAKAGLVFVEIARYEHIVHVRQTVLRGSSNQVLLDRVDSSWCLVEATNRADARSLVQSFLDALSCLISLKSLGYTLESLEILRNTTPPSVWHLQRDQRDELQYLVQCRLPEDSLSLDILPSSAELLNAITKLDSNLELIRTGERVSCNRSLVFIHPHLVRKSPSLSCIDRASESRD